MESGIRQVGDLRRNTFRACLEEVFVVEFGLLCAHLDVSIDEIRKL
jgi:hypothetical protein